MCSLRNSKKIEIYGKTIHVDKCLEFLIPIINETRWNTLGACCGHHKYPMTIIAQNEHGEIFEIVSGKRIPRTKRFYVKNKNGYYYVPETIQQK